MRLTYFSGSLIPSTRANSVHVMKMCAAFARQGAEVTLFGKRGGGENPFEFYGAQDNFSLCLSPFKNGFLRLLFSACHFLKSEKPDIAYGRDPWMIWLASWRCPVVLELHEVPRGWQGKIVRALLKNKNTKLVVCISNGLKKNIETSFCLSDELTFLVAPDGADAAPHNVGLAFESAGLAIGYAGSLLPGKGAEVVAALAQKMPDFNFHICGGDAVQIEKVRRSYPAKNITYHGHIAHAKLPSYLAAFDIVLAPYQEDMELRTGVNIARWISPLKLFEYMAAGKATICSDLPVLREVMRDGETCLLVPPADEAAWQAAIERLVQDTPLRFRLGQQARTDLEANYTWDKRAANLLGAVKNTLPSLQ